jgi:hypothetical protein
MHLSHRCSVGQRLQKDWLVDGDGWVIIDGSKRVIWVLPEARGTPLHPYHIAAISQQGSLRLDFSEAKIGEEWDQCYVSEKASGKRQM